MSVHLSPLLSSGMVLQRDAEVTLWGTADEKVAIEFLGQLYHTEPDMNGNWRISLPPLSPGGPFPMRVGEHMLEDVYVGDVWLCTGQSNMQLTMDRVRHMYPEAREETTPLIRQFTVPERYDFHSPRAELDGGAWQAATPESLSGFSAVGWFFAKRLFSRYRVPIGLLQCAIGGTPIHAWMSHRALSDFPPLLEKAELCRDDAYVARVQHEDAENLSDFFAEIDRTDPGMAEKWFLPDLDDSGWETRTLTVPWEGTGSVWFRKTLSIPPAMAGKPATLFLGTVTDWDAVYVNGQLIGNTTYRYPPREYTLPALPAGRCVLAIRAVSQNGGGFTPGKQYLLSTPDGCVNLNSSWRFHRGGHALPYPPETFFRNQPTGLFQGMLAPLQRYRIRGAIWYQGESDADQPSRYAEKCAAMVKDWRSAWGFPFPFLFTELAHWESGPHWDSLRREQWKALEEIPCSAMAAGDDTGEHNDLHPQNKQIIADRLARCAMRLSYGETLPSSPFEIIPLRGL